MPHCFSCRLAHGLSRAIARAGNWHPQAQRKHRHDDHENSHRHHGWPPTGQIEQMLGAGDEKEHAQRTRRDNRAKDDAATLVRHDLADRSKHNDIGRAAETQSH